MSGFIYLFTFPNGKFYVGQTKNVNVRWAQHKNAAYTSTNPAHSFPLYKAIRKYGWHNIHKEILEECTTEELNSKEIDYIKFYNCVSPNGYNMNTGGDSFTMSEETKLKIGASVKRHQQNLSPKSLSIWKENVRKKHIGKHNLRDDSKQQISYSLKNFYKLHPQKEGTKNKRSESRRKRGKGLPRFVNIREYKFGEIYCISKHPLLKYKQFTNLDECLKELEILNTKYQIIELKKKLEVLMEINASISKQIDNLYDLIDSFKRNILQKIESSSETKCQSVVETT